MSTLDILKELKRFLPNNTANKLLKNDLVYFDKGSVVFIRFNALTDYFQKTRDQADFIDNFKTVYNNLIEQYLKTTYKHGGTFLKFDIGQLLLIFEEELVGNNPKDTFCHAIETANEIFAINEKFVAEMNDSANLDLDGFISAGAESGSFVDLILGNDKRKERIVLGNIISSVMELGYDGKCNDIMVTGETYQNFKKEITCVRKNSHFAVKDTKLELNSIVLPKDNYLNLKTSIIKSFMPNHILDDLKESISTDFTTMKEGGVIYIEFAGMHEYASDFLSRYPAIIDDSEKKIFLDDFYFSLNKLFKKLFRFTSSYDGTINRVDYAVGGIKIQVSFSLPKSFVNDHKNKLICVEEIQKISAPFKNFPFKILYFDDYIYSTIAGCENRACYLIYSPIFSRLNDFAKEVPSCTARHLNPDDVSGSITNPQSREDLCEEISDISEITVDNEDEDKTLLAGLHSHKVIGRNKEIITLNQLFREGGKIVTVTGEYGSGKTRLVEEIVARMKNENYQILHTKVENRDNIIDLFKYLIEEQSGITIFDSKSDIENKLNNYFKELLEVTAGDDEKELFGSKLFILYKIMYNIDTADSPYSSLSPTLRLENLKEALSLYLIFNYYYFSLNSEGIIFVFDDIDNLKHEEKDLMQYVIQYSISHLVERGNRRNKKGEINRISFMVTHHIKEEIDFNRFLKPVRLELAPLKKDTMRQLLKEMIGGKKLPSEIEKVILKKAEGNPFYLEQYFRYVIQNGMIEQNEDLIERTKLYKKKEVPCDIVQTVQSNLAKLPPHYLRFLQAASVVGVRFDYEVVKTYYDELPESELVEIMKTFYIKKYINQDYYTFSHPIVSDVLYKMASETDRLEWHRRVSVLLEDTLKNSNIANPNWQGHHYSLAQDSENAKKYLRMAYEVSLEKNFLEAAFVNLKKYISLLDDGLDKDNWLLKKADLLYLMSKYEEARKIVKKLQAHYEAATNPDFLNQIYNMLLHYSFDHYTTPKAKELLQKKALLCRKASEKDLESGILYKYYALLKLREAKNKHAAEYLRKAISFTNLSGDWDTGCFLFNKLGELYETQYNFVKSIETFITGLDLARQHNSLEYQSILLGNLGKISYKIGKIRDSITYYQEALRIASKLSLKEIEAKCASELGNIYLEIRDLTKAQLNMELAVKIYRALNNIEEISYRLSDLGECYIYQNNQVEGEKSFNKAYKMAKEINSGLARAYAMQNIARVKVLKKSYDEAELTFKDAIKIYREKKLFKRIGMVYYYLAEMHFKQLTEYEDDTFSRYKQQKMEDITNIIKYVDYSLSYSKKAKNLHFIAMAHLLMGKILRRKQRIAEAVKEIQAGLTTAKLADYSRMQVELYVELAACYRLLDRHKDAESVLKNIHKQAVKHNDIKAKMTIEKDLKLLPITQETE